MGAIFGIIHLDGRPAARSDLDLMNTALAVHGPDGNRVWCQGNIGFGERLMCFTPEDRRDVGRATDNCGGPVIIGDARIDNRPELANELSIPAAEARELSDSAFILRAYEKWGLDCPTRLIGAFVFALCDLRQQRVLIARSPMGERSLFYYETPRLFAFASAPKGLFALPFVPREIDLQTIADLLVFAPREPGSSFFSRLNSLRPGHAITIEGSRFKTRHYRELNIHREIRFSRDSDYVEAFEVLFDRVISDQMRSLTPAGVSMSGGLDSTSIAAVAAGTPGQKGERLHTFTEVPRPGFSGKLPQGRYADETPYVEAMARKYPNLDVHFVRSDGRFYLDELDGFFDAAEMPMRGASNWTWMAAIMQEARRQNARVVLTGAPGNLTISWAGQGLFTQLLGHWKWARALREARAVAARNVASSAARLLVGQGLMPLLPDRLWLAVNHLRGGIPGFGAGPVWQRYSPIRPEFASAQRADVRAREKGHDFRFRSSPAARAQHLIAQADRRADARRGQEALFGVQNRDPAADERLVEFCLSIPEDQYLRKGEPRWLIRRAMAERLPVEVLNNKQRGLQAADWFESMRLARSRILKEIARLEKSALVRDAIDLGRLHRLAERMQGARSDPDIAVSDYRGVLELGLTAGRFLLWAGRPGQVALPETGA
jgi:asparagine synthase (glutamine-hydrolysing)